MGTELAIKNYDVIRIYEKSFIPQYDINNKFPFACDGENFEIVKKKTEFKTKSLEEIIFISMISMRVIDFKLS